MLCTKGLLGGDYYEQTLKASEDLPPFPCSATKRRYCALERCPLLRRRSVQPHCQPIAGFLDDLMHCVEHRNSGVRLTLEGLESIDTIIEERMYLFAT